MGQTQKPKHGTLDDGSIGTQDQNGKLTFHWLFLVSRTPGRDYQRTVRFSSHPAAENMENSVSLRKKLGIVDVTLKIAYPAGVSYKTNILSSLLPGRIVIISDFVLL